MIASAFNDVLVIDHIVPERDIVTKRNNRYILSITDVFTGYLMALPAKTKTSEETIRLINTNWCAWKGWPKEIIADNDPGFTSTFYNAVLKAFDIKTTHGTPYKCSSTSKGERSNKRINTALRIMLDDTQVRDWDLYLKWVCCVCNSTKSRHTGFSANRLVFGKELNTPQSILLCNHSPDSAPLKLPSQAQKAHDLHWTIKSLIRKARENGAADFLSADNWYNRHLHGPYFKEGDWCFVLINCPTHKFSKRWTGPFKVSKVVNEHLCYVEVNDTTKLYNISKLKHYNKNIYSPKDLDPETPEFVPPRNETGPSNSTGQPEPESRPAMEVEIIPDTQQPTSHLGNSTTDIVMPAPPTERASPTHPALDRDQQEVDDETHRAPNQVLLDVVDGQEQDEQSTARRYPVRDRRPVNRYQAGV